MWTIKRPNGTSYTRAHLDGLEAGYGADKEGLEAQGWEFTRLTRKEPNDAADK